MENKTLFELLDELNKIYIELAGSEIQNYRKENISVDDNRYLKVNLDNWKSKDKELLITETLNGIYYYYFKYSQQKSFPIGGFNSILNVLNGEIYIYLYKKGIVRYSDKLIKCLANHKILFLNMNKESNKHKKSAESYYDDRNWLEDASGTNDSETMNDVYWNLD